MMATKRDRGFRLVRAGLAALGLLAALAAVEPGLAAIPERTDVQRMIVEEASSTRVPASLALAVAKVESNFNPKALSSAGARGVMQIMPKTAKDIYDVDADQLWDARLNIRLGIDFLESLIKRYGGRWDLALSHYNGGSRVGRPPNARVIPATRKYVDAVLAWQKRFDRNATMMALADTAGKPAPTPQPAPNRDRQVAAYWMFEDPNIDKDWRHYLKVADYWLAVAQNGGDPLAVEPGSDLELAARQSPTDEWQPVETGPQRPSQELEQKIQERRLQFRDRLTTGDLPWPRRRDRWVEG